MVLISSCFLRVHCLTLPPFLRCCLKLGTLFSFTTAAGHDGGQHSGVFLWEVLLAVVPGSVWVNRMVVVYLLPPAERQLWVEATLEHVSLSRPDSVCGERFWALSLSTGQPCSASARWSVSTRSAHCSSLEIGRSSLGPR